MSNVRLILDGVYLEIADVGPVLEWISRNRTKGMWYEDGLLFIGVDQEDDGRGGFHLNNKIDGEYKTEEEAEYEYTETEEEANTKLCAMAPFLLDAWLAVPEDVKNSILTKMGLSVKKVDYGV